VSSHTQRSGCHCGAVEFEVEVPDSVQVLVCSCSICKAVGYQHVIVPRDRFRLLGGEDRLTEYRFNTGTARHLFCATCGVKSFYVPRSHPDGVSVNLRCLDEGRFARVDRVDFDGANWEANIGGLAKFRD
jgi:hypothetical protein